MLHLDLYFLTETYFRVESTTVFPFFWSNLNCAGNNLKEIISVNTVKNIQMFKGRKYSSPAKSLKLRQ